MFGKISAGKEQKWTRTSGKKLARKVPSLEKTSGERPRGKHRGEKTSWEKIWLEKVPVTITID